MANQTESQAITRRSSVVRSSQTTTEQSSNKSNVRCMDSGRDILEGLAWLAEAYSEPLTPERVKVYTMALSDLSPEELSMGFNRAIREQKFWPRPAELRELATGNAAIMVGKLAVDDAWEWVNRYLSLFGKLTQKRWELQGHIFHGEKFNDALEPRKYLTAIATSADFYERYARGGTPIR